MTEPVWIPPALAADVHAAQMAMLGRASPAPDADRLVSALAAARDTHAGGGDLATVAAAHALAVLARRPFRVGNEAAAFALAMLFLRLNGIDFRPAPAEASAAVASLRDGVIDLATFTDWIRTGP